ncbi:shikimate kinase [bacterium]|nr:shikimate kinase [bacterium]
MLITNKIDSFRNSSNDTQLITLVGMMGAGKSKFGYMVAKNLNLTFYDSDSLIEKQFNTSINDIFQSYGESYFRKIEKEQIKTIVIEATELGEKAIISIGGGAFDNEDTRNFLLKKTKAIWLNVPIETLIKRIGDGTKRPMIGGNIKKSISDILNKRVQYYSLSHHQLDTYSLSQEQIIKKIIEIISSTNKKVYK